MMDIAFFYVKTTTYKREEDLQIIVYRLTLVLRNMMLIENQTMVVDQLIILSLKAHKDKTLINLN
jgi:hypothetical protein